jgi:hypothetical protein
MKAKILANYEKCEKDTKMARWEYRVVPIKTRIHLETLSGTSKAVIDDLQNELDNLGKEGWELVSVQDTSTQDGRNFTVAYLKRQKQSTQNVT